MADIVLQTERLRLRRLRADDLDWLARLHGDPEVMRFVRAPDDREATAERLMSLLAEQDAHPGLGVFPAERLGDGTVIGWFVLTHLDGGEDVEIGYRLFVEHWGQGFATEGARALADHAFATLELDALVAVAQQANGASMRVLEKCGFERRGVRRAYGLDLAYFVREKPPA